MTRPRSRSAEVERLAASARSALRSAATPSKFDLRAYLGAPAPVLGVSAPALERIARAILRPPNPLPDGLLLPLARRLWRGATYDERALAIVLLHRSRAGRTPAAWTTASVWVDRATGWGLCDALAGGPIATMVAERPPRLRELIGWSRSSNPWRRRAALYALNRLVRSGNLDGPFRVIDRLREDPEFWVQRAVGTWLRECWKQDEARTRRYLERHAARLPPVALTVATERAPASLRARLRRLARTVSARRTRIAHRPDRRPARG
ncbi:MAG TPA: DNA alkylation repair protein [Thermoplasmata archaeon]|nr:DNA alkylation repair protein [Thermoplasmata archaeon]